MVKKNSQRLERLQNRAMRIILSVNRKTCTQEMRTKLDLLSLEKNFLGLQLVFKIINNINCPEQLTGYLVKRSEIRSRTLSDDTLLHVIPTKLKIDQSSFQCSAAIEWNALPRQLRDLKSQLSLFKSNVFKYLFDADILNDNILNDFEYTFCNLKKQYFKNLKFHKEEG